MFLEKLKNIYRLQNKEDMAQHDYLILLTKISHNAN
jgi:hypothetical protein